nr:cation transporting ATPase C-terminal domain-containing protein [Elusimicrobiota bacterium]
EAAHMILLDDNFATIVRAVREGRRIYGNIRRFIRYILTCNSAEIWTISLAPFLGMPIPLLPIQILWINLVTDGLPGLAMTSEPAEADVMRRPPRPPGESLFAGGMGAQIVWAGLLMAAVCLGTQYWGIAAGKARWRTMVFTVLCLSQLGQALAIRSEKRTLWELGPLTNGALLGAVALTVALQLCVIYIPVCNRLFATAPLAPGELALALGLSAVVYSALEAEKLLRRAAWK